MSSEVMQFYPEESEMAVLGHLIQNNEAFHPLAIAEGWEPGWHHNEHAIQLAEAVWEMRRKGMIVNSSTLLSHISAAGIKINDTYLAECVQADADNDTFLTLWRCNGHSWHMLLSITGQMSEFNQTRDVTKDAQQHWAQRRDARQTAHLET